MYCTLRLKILLCNLWSLALAKKSFNNINNSRAQVSRLVKVLLRKHKENGDIEIDPVYFNSTTKTAINFKFDLHKSFQEILYKIDNWINKGSG